MTVWRVSTLLRMAGLVDERWFTAASQERGRTVHLIAEQVFRGGDVDVAPAYEGYTAALRQCRSDLLSAGFGLICVERRLTDADLTGRPDLVGWLELPIGRIYAGPCILDIKSGDRYASHGVQLAHYERLVERAGLRAALPSRRDMPWQRVGIYVTETGLLRLWPYEDPQDYLMADLTLDLARWRSAHGQAFQVDTFADDPIGETHGSDEQPDRPERSGLAAVPCAGAVALGDCRGAPGRL